MSEDDFFVGWDETPSADRRFFLKAGLGLMAGTAGLAGGAAAFQNAPGPGQWDPTLERAWTGQLVAAPYPMLRSSDVDGTLRTLLIACSGKCGVAALLGSMIGKSVSITGSLVQRGAHLMISVTDLPNWIEEISPRAPFAPMPSSQPLGAVTLRGEILDSKCWFGAMRPSSGKVHKACASLCIRGGIPPAFFARDDRNRSVLMLMTDGPNVFGLNLLPYVADPVEVRGDLYQQGDVLRIQTAAAAITRL